MSVGQEFSWGLNGGLFQPLPSSAPDFAALGFGPLTGTDALGNDVLCLPDLDPTFKLQTGLIVLSQAIARRLSTPRGGLFYAPNYGIDLRGYLNASIGPSDLFTIRHAIEREAEKDERVISVSSTVDFSLAAMTLTIVLALTTSAGPFSLTLVVSQVTVTLLRVQEGA